MSESPRQYLERELGGQKDEKTGLYRYTRKHVVVRETIPRSTSGIGNGGSNNDNSGGGASCILKPPLSSSNSIPPTPTPTSRPISLTSLPPVVQLPPPSLPKK